MLLEGSNRCKYAVLVHLKKGRDRQTDSPHPGKQIRTAKLDDELHSLDGRISKREITPIISDITNIVLLTKD